MTILSATGRLSVSLFAAHLAGPALLRTIELNFHYWSDIQRVDSLEGNHNYDQVVLWSRISNRAGVKPEWVAIA